MKTLANSTIGITQEFQVSKLKLSIRYVKILNQDIKEVEQQITDLMNQYPTHFQTIKGIGVISAATILSEYGDISLFSSPAQMLSYAGLDSSIKQSGTMSTNGKLVKRGSKYLRSTLINICMIIILHNPVFYAYYHKKKLEGKHHRIALIHVAKKLIRIIFYLETNHQDFNPALLK